MSCSCTFGRILENEFRDFDRSGRGVNRPLVSALHQQRQPPNVIEMRVSKDHRIELIDIELARDVIGLRRHLAALEQTEVHHHRSPGRLNVISRASDFARRAIKSNGHFHVLAPDYTAARGRPARRKFRHQRRTP